MTVEYQGMLSTREAAELLGVTRAAVLQAIYRRRLRPDYSAPGARRRHYFHRATIAAEVARRAAIDALMAEAA